MTEDILPIPPFPDGLREAAQRGILVPFVGAGVSRIAGCPTWNEFADKAFRMLIDLGKFDYSQLTQIAALTPRVKLSIFRAILDEHELPFNFRPLFHPGESPRIHPDGQRVYSSLSKLARVFVTTNYDEWLDEEIPTTAQTPDIPESHVKLPSPRQRSVIYRVRDLTAANLDQPNTVIHLHGSLQDQDSLVMTTQDYVQHYANDRTNGDPENENRVLTFLDFLFSNKTVLFVGYGLEELEILEYIILKAGLTRAARYGEVNHYLLQGFFSNETALMKSLRRYYLRECGIVLLPYLRDYKDWAQLQDVLDEYARLVPASGASVLQDMVDMEALLDD